MQLEFYLAAFKQQISYKKGDHKMFANKLKQIEQIIDRREKYDQVLILLQEIEAVKRNNKAKRQADGIAEAREKGVKFGGFPPKPLPRNFKKIYQCYQKGMMTGAEAAACLGTNRVTFKRLSNDMSKKF